MKESRNAKCIVYLNLEQCKVIGPPEISVYTDGSCHGPTGAGAWVAIILFGEEDIRLTGTVAGTTHQRMELTAVLEALQWIGRTHPERGEVTVFTDSQYVAGLPRRRERLVSRDFHSGRGAVLPNADLVRLLLERVEEMRVVMVRVKSHRKSGPVVDYNREADLLARRLVRGTVRKGIVK